TIPNITLSVITADCVPIIFYDSTKKIIGISHQGWKGTLKKMPVQMIHNLKKVGSNPSDMFVAIGPSINECCYEVGADIAHQFASEFGEIVVINRNNRTYVNLLRANYLQLISSGIHKNHIDYFPFCTSCN